MANPLRIAPSAIPDFEETHNLEIGDNVKGGTPKSVLFLDVSGNVAQDATELSWDDATKRLGIGTGVAFAKLHVASTTPQFIVEDPTAAADNRRWQHQAQGTGVYQLQAITDAGTPGTRVVQVGRNNNEVTHLAVGNPSAPILHADASTGYCGINTSTPGERLEVNGAITVTGPFTSVAANRLQMDFSAGYSRFRSIGPDASTLGSFWFRPTHAGGGMITGMYLNQQGRLGLNTISPEALFHVQVGALAKSWGHKFTTQMVFEYGTSDVGFAFVTPSDRIGYIDFADTDDRDPGSLRYNHGDDAFSVRAADTDNRLVVRGDRSGVMGDPINGRFEAHDGTAVNATVAPNTEKGLLVRAGDQETGIGIWSNAAKPQHLAMRRAVGVGFEVRHGNATTNNYLDCYLDGALFLRRDQNVVQMSGGNILFKGVAGSAAYGADSEYSNGDSGAAITIVWDNGSHQNVTMSANCTFAFTNPTSIGAGLLTLKFTQNFTGGFSVTMPANVVIGGGTIPAISTGANTITQWLMYYDGSKYIILSTQENVS